MGELFPKPIEQHEPLSRIERRCVEINHCFRHLKDVRQHNSEFVFFVLADAFQLRTSNYLYKILGDQSFVDLEKRFDPEQSTLAYKVIMKNHYPKYYDL